MKKKYPLALLFIITCIAFLYFKSGIAANLSCQNPSGLESGVAGSGGYGPYDYRYQKDKLHIVEIAHFTTNVATLESGQSGTLDGDIGYTLQAFPNHHRALQALSDLALREHANQLPHMQFNVPCYFIRAIHFTPDDGMINAIYAYYLSRIGQKDLAKKEAENTIKKMPNNPKAFYTIGLAYFYIGEYTKAREYANKAKKLGSTAPGLENLLSQLSVTSRNNPEKK